MIEINLLPDVKQELLKAQRARTTIVSVSMLISIVAIGVVVALAMFIFGGQKLLKDRNEKTITDEHTKLTKIDGLTNALTVNNQINQISDQHAKAALHSRAFDIVAALTPAEADKIDIRDVSIDTEAQEIKIEATAPGGYHAFEAFKKLIIATNFVYRKAGDDKSTTVPLAKSVTDGDRSFGQDSTGAVRLRFELILKYDSAVLDRSSTEAKIIGPTKRIDVTDSTKIVPKGVFTGGQN